MTDLPATLGASDEQYRRLGMSKDHIELWEDGMRTDGGKGTYEWWYFDAYLNDGSKLAITFRTKPIIDVGKTLDPFSMRDVAIESDTGKPVAHQVIYEYIDGPERYVLTFTREKDTLHYKFIEELHGIKARLARLLHVDGAYLRFTGELSLEHYQADQLIETQRDEALWELMYFGHVTRK